MRGVEELEGCMLEVGDWRVAEAGLCERVGWIFGTRVGKIVPCSVFDDDGGKQNEATLEELLRTGVASDLGEVVVGNENGSVAEANGCTISSILIISISI